MFLTSFQLRVGFVFGIVSFFFLQTKVALGFSKMGQTKKRAAELHSPAARIKKTI